MKWAYRRYIVMGVVLVGIAVWLVLLRVLPTGPNPVAVQKLAEAIAFAEGFYVRASRPARNHNPGDLTLDTTGRAVGKDGAYVVYRNDADGWEALRQQLRLIYAGKSRYYTPDMTIAQMAAKYTATEQDAWAVNVARKLGVNINTKLSELK